VVAGIEYLDRGTPAQLLEAPAASLAYARAAAEREVPLSALVGAHRIGHSRFLEAAMRHISLVEPALQVPTIIGLMNRSASFVDIVADQLMGVDQRAVDGISPISGMLITGPPVGEHCLSAGGWSTPTVRSCPGRLVGRL